jgi:hypothetical protein
LPTWIIETLSSNRKAHGFAHSVGKGIVVQYLVNFYYVGRSGRCRIDGLDSDKNLCGSCFIISTVMKVANEEIRQRTNMRRELK